MKQKDRLISSKPLACFFAQAGVGTAFTYLTSGVYLSGLAILMGAGDLLTSYISVIVNICGVLILAFSAFLERFHSRKRLTVALTVLSRLATLLIVAIPVAVPERLRLPLFVATVVVSFTLQAQTTVVLNQWMLGFVEERKSGRYISLRQTATLTVTVLFSAAGGYWMDRTGGSYTGFAALFLVAALMGGIEVALLLATPDSEAYAAPAHRCRLWELVAIPLRDRGFAGFVRYIFCFYLLLYVADSFTMLFLMKYLALPYQTVTGLYLLISLPQVLWLGIWGKLADRYGHAAILTASIWLFTGETLFMAFVTPTSWQLFVPVAFLIASAANAGFVVSVFNRRYQLMPKTNRIIYDNFYTAAIGVGFIVGPMLGGLLKSFLEAIPALQRTLPFAGIRGLYLISTAGIVLLQTVHLVLEHKRRKQLCQPLTCTSTPG